MAKFTYIYRSSDGVRHTEQMSAASRDEVFASLREKGIKAIKVIADDGTKANGAPIGVRRRYVVLFSTLAAIVAAVCAYWSGLRKGSNNPGTVVVSTENGPVTVSVAQPLARQEILGSRARLDDFSAGIFNHPAEAYLARFAEPGRPLRDFLQSPTEDEFRASLADPIYCASNELTEYIDLKRIVVGIKREMAAYLEGGGTIEGYVAELVKRQKMESAYRENAEKRLLEMLSSGKSESDTYEYWLKANAQLQAMGIYPLTIPDSLREYQLNLDLGE